MKCKCGHDRAEHDEEQPHGCRAVASSEWIQEGMYNHLEYCACEGFILKAQLSADNINVENQAAKGEREEA